VGRRDAVGRRGRGGEDIPSLRALRLRIASGLAASALAAALAVYPVLHADLLVPLVAVLGAAGTLLVVTAAVTRGAGLAAAVVLLGAAYVAVEATGRVPATSVVAYAVGLVAIAELVLGSGELPRAALVERAAVVERGLTLSAIGLASALLALVALAADGVSVGAGFETALVGMLAAVALLALPWLALRRPR
jgi:hypothetical protein